MLFLLNTAMQLLTKLLWQKLLEWLLLLDAKHMEAKLVL
jgi:hypothetical protein